MHRSCWPADPHLRGRDGESAVSIPVRRPQTGPEGSSVMNGIGSANPLRAIGQGRRACRPGTATHLDAPLRRVDPDVAHDIAQLFLDAPALGGERLVSAAYRELQVQTDLQFAELTEPDGLFGYTVVWTKLPDPYS